MKVRAVGAQRSPVRHVREGTIGNVVLNLPCLGVDMMRSLSVIGLSLFIH